LSPALFFFFFAMISVAVAQEAIGLDGFTGAKAVEELTKHVTVRMDIFIFHFVVPEQGQ
jgi:hypothetical protein